MNVQNKIVYIFNKFLINFLKEIKKENYFKVAIKKNYRVIDKNSDKYIKTFKKKFDKFNELLCTESLEVNNLLENEEFINLNILKNINIGRLFNVFKTDEDRNTVLSYILTLKLLSMFYSETIRIHEKLMKLVNSNEKILDDDDVVDERLNVEYAVHGGVGGVLADEVVLREFHHGIPGNGIAIQACRRPCF